MRETCIGGMLRRLCPIRSQGRELELSRLEEDGSTFAGNMAETQDGEEGPQAAAAEEETTRAGLEKLQALDVGLIEALASGAIKLVDADYLRRPQPLPQPPPALSSDGILRRQDLERVERETGVRIFLTAEEAMACLASGGRRVGGLTYAWLSNASPDPTAAYFVAVRRALLSCAGQHIQALFWDYASLPQKPRTTAEDGQFARALEVMANVYASATGVTVLRHRAIPARPPGLDGALILRAPSELETPLALGDDGGAAAAVTSRLGLSEYGDVRSVRHDGAQGVWAIQYASHAQAEAALVGLCSTVEEGGGALWLAFNGRPYEWRGWPTFESAVSTEVLARAAYYPKLRAALDRLPPKMLEIDEVDGSGEPTPAPVVDDGGEGAGPRLTRVREAIRGAHFTGKGDKSTVTSLYNSYVSQVSNAFYYSGEKVDETYEGERGSEGQREGVGVLRYADGGVYEGRFAAGELHGVGRYLYESGDVYEGEWVAGHMEGVGTYMDAKGNVYRGEWREDMQEGRGTYWAADGFADVCRYHEDREVGEGARWSVDRRRAWRRHDGEELKEISLETAEAIASSLDLPVPPRGAPGTRPGLNV